MLDPTRFLSETRRTSDPSDIRHLLDEEDRENFGISGVTPIPQQYDPSDISWLLDPEDRINFIRSDARLGQGAAPVLDPFARQRREWRALGKTEAQISGLDRGLEALRSLPPHKRRAAFNDHYEIYQGMGMSDQEIDNILPFIDLTTEATLQGVQEAREIDKTPAFLRGYIAQAQTQTSSGNVPLPGVPEPVKEYFSNVKRNYKELIHKPLVKLGEKERGVINKARGEARDWLHYIPSVQETKDVIDARNWKKLDQWADMGRLPAMDEMGEDYFPDLLKELAQEYDPKQLRALQRVLGYSFANPRSSWYQRGEPMPAVSNEFIAKHPVLATVPLVLSAPEEWVKEQLTHPETWPRHAAFYVGGKYIINPATRAGLRWLNQRFPINMSMKNAWKFYKESRFIRRTGRPVPLTIDEFQGFLNNLAEPDISRHIVVRGTSAEKEMMLQGLSKRFAGIPRDQLEYMRLFMESSNGEMVIFVPKDPSFLQTYVGRAGGPVGGFTPTPSAAGAAVFPGRGTTPLGPGLPTAPFDLPTTFANATAVAGSSAAGSATAASIATQEAIEMGEPMANYFANAAVNAQQIEAARQGHDRSSRLLTDRNGFTDDQISMAIRTGSTPQEIRELQMVFTNQEIIDEFIKTYPIATPTVQDELLLTKGTKVKLPWQGNLEATVTDISDPQNVKLRFADGTEGTLPPQELQVLPRPEEIKNIPLMGEGVPLRGDRPPASIGTPEFLEDWVEQGVAIPDDVLVRYPHLAHRYPHLKPQYDIALAQVRADYKAQGHELVAKARAVSPTSGQEPPPPKPLPPETPPIRPSQAIRPEPTDPRLTAKSRQVTPPQQPVPDKAPVPESKALEPWEQPLENFILRGAPPEYLAVRDHTAKLRGFDVAPEAAIRDYVYKLGRLVTEYMPEKLAEFEATRRALDMGRATAADFDQVFASAIHRDLARVQFADEMKATGIDDPLEAAMATHRNTVQQRLEQGLDVPDGVLEDYPDLAAEYNQLKIDPVKSDLQALGYTEYEIRKLQPGERERLANNDIPANSVHVTNDGNAVYSAFRDAKANPKNYATTRTRQEIQAELQNLIKDTKGMLADPDLEGGFVNIPTLDEMKAQSSALVARARAVFAPTYSTIFHDVFGAIEMWRSNTNLAGLYSTWNKDRLMKLITTDPRFRDRIFRGEKKVRPVPELLKIVDDYADNPAKYQRAFDTLPEGYKQLYKALRADYEELYRFATDQDILDSWVENYTPHVYSDHAQKISSVIFPRGRGKLGTGFSPAMQRKIKTKDDARELGLHPIDDPIFKNGAYRFQLFKALANKHLIQTLMAYNDKNGVPYIMHKPTDKTGLFAEAWQQYKTVDIPGLERLKFQNTHDEIPVLIRESVRVHPEVYNILKDLYSRNRERGKFERAYTYARGLIKRGKMLNPAIHTWNIVSDVWNEANFNPWKTAKIFLRGREMWKTQDEKVEFFIKHGLETATAYTTSVDLRRQARALTPEVDDHWKGVRKMGRTWSAMVHKSDEVLWHSVVLNAQLGTTEMVYNNLLAEHPDWPPEKAAKVASHYVNTLLGSLPHTWISKWARIAGSNLLFARNWCVSSDTRAMTKKGWKYHHELSIGDEIMTFDPDNGQMRWSPMLDKFENESYSGDMIEIRNYNKKIRMTPDHKCYVWNYSKCKHEIVFAKDLKSSHLIPRVGSWEFGVAKKPIFSDWFVRVVGWMVTDGHIKSDKYETKSGPKVCRYGVITQSKPKGVRELKKLDLNSRINKPREHNTNAAGTQFVERHPVHTFYVPTEVIRMMDSYNLSDGLDSDFLSCLTRKQLQLLYDTMMLGDGTGQHRFCGKESEVFYMTLIQTMLGKPSTFYQQEENCWRTRIISSDKIRCHDRMDTVQYEGTIWCPSVETGFWLAEGEGIVFVTGNTLANWDIGVKAFSWGLDRTVGKVARGNFVPTDGGGPRGPGGGVKGRGLGNLSDDEKDALGKMNMKHWIKGLVVGILLMPSMVQMMYQLITNQLKKDGQMDGPIVPVIPSFMNPPGHRMDIFWGHDKRGAPRYVVPLLMRYFRDYPDWGFHPARTALNKAAPLPKAAVEAVANYSFWQHKKIIPPGAKGWDKMRLGMRFFFESFTPITIIPNRPGRVPDPIDYIAPVAGFWIRRGPPGGRYTELMFQYRDEKKFTTSKVDKELSVHLQKGEFGQYLNKGLTRYKTMDAVIDRAMRHKTPLSSRYREMSTMEKLEFHKWLKDNHHSIEGLHREMSNEVQSGLRDAYTEQDVSAYTLDDLKQEKRAEEQILAPGANQDLLDGIKQFEQLNQ